MALSYAIWGHLCVHVGGMHLDHGRSCTESRVVSIPSLKSAVFAPFLTRFFGGRHSRRSALNAPACVVQARGIHTHTQVIPNPI